MKNSGGVDVENHVFLASALVGVEWSASRLVTKINLRIFRRFSLSNFYEALLHGSSEKIRTAIMLYLGEMKIKNMLFR
jgi:hypothetical protein